MNKSLDKIVTEKTSISKSQNNSNRRKIDYDFFGKLVRNHGNLIIDNKYTQIEDKRKILFKSGYTHLTGKNNTRIPIEEVDDYRLGTAFIKVYKQYKLYLKRNKIY